MSRIFIAYLLIVASALLPASGRPEPPEPPVDGVPLPLRDSVETWVLPLVFSGAENPAALRAWESGLLAESAAAWFPAAFRWRRGEKLPQIRYTTNAPHRRLNREELAAGIYQYTVEVPALSSSSRRAGRHTVSFRRIKLYTDGKPHTQPGPYALQRIILQTKKNAGHIRLVSIAYSTEDDSFTAVAELWD